MLGAFSRRRWLGEFAPGLDEKPRNRTYSGFRSFRITSRGRHRACPGDPEY
jgi:hypothetical protein